MPMTIESLGESELEVVDILRTFNACWRVSPQDPKAPVAFDGGEPTPLQEPLEEVGPEERRAAYLLATLRTRIPMSLQEPLGGEGRGNVPQERVQTRKSVRLASKANNDENKGPSATITEPSSSSVEKNTSTHGKLDEQVAAEKNVDTTLADSTNNQQISLPQTVQPVPQTDVGEMFPSSPFVSNKEEINNSKTAVCSSLAEGGQVATRVPPPRARAQKKGNARRKARGTQDKRQGTQLLEGKQLDTAAEDVDDQRVPIEGAVAEERPKANKRAEATRDAGDVAGASGVAVRTRRTRSNPDVQTVEDPVVTGGRWAKELAGLTGPSERRRSSTKRKAVSGALVEQGSGKVQRLQ